MREKRILIHFSSVSSFKWRNILTASKSRRSEKAGLFRFGKEMTSALAMALIFIVYIIQAFKIPTGSMEKSLLIGDFLLGLKFLYGSPVVPFSYKKFPSLSHPTAGDVVIFEYPGNDFEIGNRDFANKDFIKRCVAGPGQTIESRGTRLLIDGKNFILPPHGQYRSGGALPVPGVSNFAPLRVPKKGDTIVVGECSTRDFLFLRNLVAQEHPGSRLKKFLKGLQVFWTRPAKEDTKLAESFSRVRMDFTLLVDGAVADTTTIRVQSPFGQLLSRPFKQLIKQYPVNRVTTWVELHEFMEYMTARVRESVGEKEFTLEKKLYLDGQPVTRYVVKNDNYFMMGDNRDDSADSRYWGYVNRNFVKAKAFILYFSLDSETPLILLPLKIRWNRIGKLIRSWNGLNPPSYYK
ncbi:MAG: signal peptidase I [Chitinispirillaceae bacterium]|nr:signal peptidase I [Chitinispirillaceae bacterium]